MLEVEKVTWRSGALVQGEETENFMGLDCVLSFANQSRARRRTKKTRSATGSVFLFIKYQHFQRDLYKYVSFSSYRYAKYYKENNTEKRTLIKAFGIRFDILVFGTVSLFSLSATGISVPMTVS